MAADASQVLLAKTWDESMDPTGWWMSEKLDGVRAYWSGTGLYSRQGNQFVAPDFWTEKLPKTPLDGELWCGHGTFSDCMSVIKKTKNLVPEEWKKVSFLVFDAPKHGGTYEERVAHLNKTISKLPYCRVVGIQKCKGAVHLETLLQDVTKNKGGEGIMLRKPGSHYEWKRSATLLKVKMWLDEEAKIIGYKQGNSNPQHKHLQCELPSGNKFSIGNGFTDHEHRNPPPIGSIITFKFQEYTHLGTPRFPTFLRKREDMTWEDVKKNWGTVNDKQKKSVARGTSLLFDDEKTVGLTKTTTSDAIQTSPLKSTPKAGGGSSKPMCSFGAACTRKNPAHFQEYDHPNRPSDPVKTPSAPASPVKEVCRYGAQCNRTNDDHFQRFSHPADHHRNKQQATKPALPKMEIDDDPMAIESTTVIYDSDFERSNSDQEELSAQFHFEMEEESSDEVALVSKKEVKQLMRRIDTLEKKYETLKRQIQHDDLPQPKKKKLS